jgi:hypothetical protein
MNDNRDLDDLDWDAKEHEMLDKIRADKAAKLAKRKAGKIPEREVQKAICSQLELLGYMVIRVNSSVQTMEHGTRLSAYRVVNINATSGHADLAVYKDGRAWMLEVKTQTGRTSPSQHKFSDCCLRYGVPYGVVRSVGEAVNFVRENL